MLGRPRSRRRKAAATVFSGLLLAFSSASLATAAPASAESYAPVSGAGSTWSQNAIDQWRRDVAQYGMRVNYSGTGSSDGRRQFLNTTVDFAASDIPFQFTPEDGSPPEDPAAKGLTYAYMPITAGGTVFMYNLTINGKRVTNLRLSGENITKIFTGVLTSWDDPAIAADNPGLTLPAKTIVPVVRSDGSGSTAQFTMWMISQHADLWNAFCHQTGRSACGQTSYYPTQGKKFIAQAGDLGVAGYVAQGYGDGAVGYVNYSYALNAGFPVVKLLNASGYYTEPSPSNVAVSLLKSEVNTDSTSRDYLTQKLDGVYTDPDPRTYPLSSYSYVILPTKVQGQFSQEKGKTLGAFLYYAMCQGQQQSASLGYSPMPINLVQAGFDQIRKVPGVVVQDITVKSCNNPTFAADGSNRLAGTAPQPQACDQQGTTQSATGTGGAAKITTAVKTPTGSAATGGAGATTTTVAGGAASSRGSARGGTTTTLRGAVAVSNGAGSKATVTTTVGSGSGSGTATATATGDPSVVAGVLLEPDTTPTTTGMDVAAVAAPLTLATARGWTGTQTLMVLAALFTICLVLAPGLAWIILAKPRRS
jgi:phosphate ABC transporter phosphate-binding protein